MALYGPHKGSKYQFWPYPGHYFQSGPKVCTRVDDGQKDDLNMFWDVLSMFWAISGHFKIFDFWPPNDPIWASERGSKYRFWPYPGHYVQSGPKVSTRVDDGQKDDLNMFWDVLSMFWAISGHFKIFDFWLPNDPIWWASEKGSKYRFWPYPGHYVQSCPQVSTRVDDG